MSSHRSGEPTSSSSSGGIHAHLLKKRSLSNASASSSKRAMSAEPPYAGSNVSDTEVEGSLGASRLHIDSNTSSPVSESAPLPRHHPVSSAAAQSQAAPGDLPAYEDVVVHDDELTPPDESAAVPMPSSQWDLVQDYMRSKDVTEGESYFLISRKWYRQWQAHCTGVAEEKDDDPDAQLGPIDNRELADERGNLRKGLQDGVHLEIMPATAWNMLKSW